MAFFLSFIFLAVSPVLGASHSVVDCSTRKLAEPETAFVAQALVQSRAERDSHATGYQEFLAPGRVLSSKAFGWLVEGPSPRIPREHWARNPAESAEAAWTLMKQQFDLSLFESKAAGKGSMKPFADEVERRAAVIGVSPKEFLRLKTLVAEIAGKPAKEKELRAFLGEHLAPYALLRMERDEAKRAFLSRSAILRAIPTKTKSVMRAIRNNPDAMGAILGIGSGVGLVGLGLAIPLTLMHPQPVAHAALVALQWVTSAGALGAGLVQGTAMARAAGRWVKTFFHESRFRGRFKRPAPSATERAIAAHYLKSGEAEELAALTRAEGEYQSRDLHFASPAPLDLGQVSEHQIIALGAEVDEAASEAQIDFALRVEQLLDLGPWKGLEDAVARLQKASIGDGRIKKSSFLTQVGGSLRQQIDRLSHQLLETERMAADAERLHIALAANPITQLTGEQLEQASGPVTLALQTRLSGLQGQITMMQASRLALGQLQERLGKQLEYLRTLQSAVGSDSSPEIYVPEAVDTLLGELGNVIRPSRSLKPVERSLMPPQIGLLEKAEPEGEEAMRVEQRATAE